jgi:L-lactate dehydrogenase complex protein LldG
MTLDPKSEMISRIRSALGRDTALREAPVPPEIDEPVARLVYSDIGLPELFQKRARDNSLQVEQVRIDDLLPSIVAFLREQKCSKVMLSSTRVLTNLGAVHFLSDNGFQARTWRQISADEAYDFDAGLTEVDFAVAETGSLVLRHRPEHGRLLSLVPFLHIAIVQPKDLVPDLIDLFERLAAEGTGSGVTIISGPSKTSDIEMTLVQGVHGPNVVKVFLLA